MTTFKGENSTISLKEEDEWGKPLTNYAGAKVFQNNDGTFNAERSALESEARTPNAELAGQRLGNTNVAGSFPVEIDPENYSKLLESAFYSEFSKTGSDINLSGATINASASYMLTITVSSGDQSTLGATIGSAYFLEGFSDSAAEKYQGGCILVGQTGTTLTFFVPKQNEAAVADITSDVDIKCLDTLRPAKTRKSFNAEETLYGEDGSTTARFMTVGAIVSGVEFNIPSDGNLQATFSFVGSGKTPSKEYSQFDANLTDGQAAHTATVPHEKYDPLVVQDGAIVSEDGDIRCRWLSGSVTVENGTETFFTGCSYDARGANSGQFRVNVSYEALFEGEDDYINFKNQRTTRILLVLKDRATDRALLLYLPAFKATSYSINNGTGLVTASISGSAEVSDAAGNSAILGMFAG